MLFIRLFGLLALIGIGGSLVAWMLTGKARYRRWAWNAGLAGVAVIFMILVLFALERLFLPRA